jgi:hypothetical protein
VIDAWRPYNIKDLAPKIHCPVLALFGEAEMAQSNERVALSSLRFLSELSGPLTIHIFGYEEGWAATHCQIGAVAPTQAVLFDWLDRAIHEKESLPWREAGNVFEMAKHYFRSQEGKSELDGIARQIESKSVV